MNPLSQSFDTPLNSIPFSKINLSHLKENMEEAIIKIKENIQKIIDSPETPSFKNTIEAFELTGEDYRIATKILFNLNNAETTPELQQYVQELSPKLVELKNFSLFNPILFEKIKSIYEHEDRSLLTSEQIRLLERTYDGYVRNGALLNEEQKDQLNQIEKEISRLSLQFNDHILKDTNAYFLPISDKEKLAGIPENDLIMAENEAKKRGLKGWVWTLQAPSISAILKNATDRELRKTIYLASNKRGFQANENNNEDIIKQLIRLKQDKAQLLGYQHFADYTLSDRMAKSPEKVMGFLGDLLAKSKPFAEKEINELKKIAKFDGISELMPYDHAYYSEKLKKQTLDFSDEEIKPYFSLENTLNAVFYLSEQLFGLTFIKRNDIEGYHPDVQVYEIQENGEFKALLYTDFYPREGKKQGAWMTSFKGQSNQKGKEKRPFVSIVCNFPKPNDNTPSLLNFMEVTTLFHEMGHALHGILADTTYESLSGTSVLWDFVELPSQFLENYCYEKEFLQQFAKHYQTGEPLPDEMIDKIIQSSNFMEGFQTLRQVSFGLLDMAYHQNPDISEKTIKAFEKEAIGHTQLYPSFDETCFSTAFSHIFGGGYASGYYSYKWAEVLDADAFEYFKQQGIFNQEVAQKYKHLLSQGGSQDPMKLYLEFRGQEPHSKALLKRAGLIK